MKIKNLCLLFVFFILPFSQSHAESVLVDNWNKGGVSNWPNALTKFELTQSTYISYIDTYHWNNGKGSFGNNFGAYIKIIELNSNKKYGPWKVQLRSGTNNAPNVHWIVHPNITLPPGTYIINDSDPATWSHNNASNNVGFSKVISGSTDGLLSGMQSSSGNAIQSKSNWSHIGHANNVVAMAENDGKLFVVTKDNKLWMRDTVPRDINWSHIGHANNVTAMAANNGKLFVATQDNKLWTRDTVPRDVDWSHIGHANNVIAMAENNGKLFAATKDNKLWMRNPVP